MKRMQMQNVQEIHLPQKLQIGETFSFSFEEPRIFVLAEDSKLCFEEFSFFHRVIIFPGSSRRGSLEIKAIDKSTLYVLKISGEIFAAPQDMIKAVPSLFVRLYNLFNPKQSSS
jgi:hypothetical protein